MKSFTLHLLILAVVSIPVSGYSQRVDLKNLGKKLEKKTEQAVERTVERAADKAIRDAEREVTQPSQNSRTPESAGSTDGAANTAPEFSGDVIYVSKQNGSNRNDGSKSSPLKNLDRAIQAAKPGGTIHVTGGIETGTLDAGFIEADKAVKIYGSWDEGFTKQSIKDHPTVIQPTNESARSNRKGADEVYTGCEWHGVGQSGI
ncbi:MAG: DUF1565 domain-containing protein [Ignavibacteria bacterium]|nr:DUF1565 domain-containing protein [Ignavibacteria bacterium]